MGREKINVPDSANPSNPDIDSSKPDTHPSPPGISDKDFWEQVAKKYGTEVAERLKAFGEDGRKLIEQYGDDLADIIGRLSDADVKKAIELINVYGVMQLVY